MKNKVTTTKPSKEATAESGAIIYESQHAGVRTLMGRDGVVKYAIFRPYNRSSNLLVEIDKDKAVGIAKSIEFYGGNFREAQASGWKHG